jgi:hypothetical protein
VRKKKVKKIGKFIYLVFSVQRKQVKQTKKRKKKKKGRDNDFLKNGITYVKCVNICTSYIVKDVRMRNEASPEYIYIYREREITMVPNAVGGFDVTFVPLKLFPRWNGHYQACSITHNGS